MGDGIAAHRDLIASSPEVVEGFVHASLKAYTYALAHPEEAIELLIKRSPTLKAEVEIAKLKATAPLLETADSKAYGIGYSSKARWEEAQQMLDEGKTATSPKRNMSRCLTPTASCRKSDGLRAGPGDKVWNGSVGAGSATGRRG